MLRVLSQLTLVGGTLSDLGYHCISDDQLLVISHHSPLFAHIEESGPIELGVILMPRRNIGISLDQVTLVTDNVGELRILELLLDGIF